MKKDKDILQYINLYGTTKEKNILPNLIEQNNQKNIWAVEKR
jgi:hypothetical protein